MYTAADTATLLVTSPTVNVICAITKIGNVVFVKR